MKQMLLLSVLASVTISTNAFAAGSSAPISVSHAEELVRQQAADPQKASFHNVHTTRNGAVCGDMQSPGDKVSTTFGLREGETPVLFRNDPVPAALDFVDVNDWINRSVALEDLEDLSCVPKGTAVHFRNRLNKVLENRKDSTTTR